MTDLRAIAAQLNSTVRDSVLGDLGYREFLVFPPAATAPMSPPPGVRQLGDNYKDTQTIARLASNAPGGSTPSNFYEVTIPRVFGRSVLSSYGIWVLRHQTESYDALCVPVGIMEKPADWLLYLGVQRTSETPETVDIQIATDTGEVITDDLDNPINT